MNVVGIMSGTSLDGVDFVLCGFNAQKTIYKDQAHKKFPKVLKQNLESLAEGKLSFREGQKLHFELGKFYFTALKSILNTKKWCIDLIGLHGQTVYHFPPLGTTQIGEPSFLRKLGVPVVSDFRSKLLTYGTDGAPLAPIFHDEILKNNKSWGFLNLGGMSNLTTKSQSKPLFASDFGPANIFLDKAVKKLFNKEFDKDGQKSLKGLANLKILESYVKENRFFNLKHPKSCGREEFSEKEFLRLMKKMKNLDKYDILATFCEISLYPILKYLKKNPVKKLIVSGGGAKNKYFISRLKEELQINVCTSDSIGWPTESVEGAAFALLAYKKYIKKEVNLEYLGLKEPLSPLGRMD